MKDNKTGSYYLKNRMKHLTITIFFLSLVTIGILVNINRPTILVLHSYNPEYIWTSGINTGLERVLAENSWVNVNYHYMETKKKPSKEHLRRAGITARSAIERNKPDILIAFDDYAQKLAVKYYINNPDFKIVFGGINGSISPYGYDEADNVTGILERKPVKALKEVLTYLSNTLERDIHQPGQQMRTIFLADTTYSAKRDAEYIESYDWQPIQQLKTEFIADFPHWQKAVRQLEGKADFLMVGAYRKLKRSAEDPKFVPAAEVMHWTNEHSPIPVIGMNVFNTEDGAAMSVGVSPYEQGEVTAHMAIDIINGKNVRDIPVLTSQQYVVSMRQSAMQARGVTIPKIYEAFARATNNYFE